MIGWATLILLPRGWVWAGWLPRFVVPAVLALSYSILVLVHFFSAEGGFDSIDAVRQLFASDPLMLAGWQHYLAFDLLIGCWLASQMDEANIHRLIQAPILVATFMLGPLGMVIGVGTLLLKRHLLTPMPAR